MKNFLKTNNENKENKIKDLEGNLVDLDKVYSVNKMNLEKNILDLETDKFNKDRELENAMNQMKSQNNNLSELNEHNNKLTSELAESYDLYGRDRTNFELTHHDYNRQAAEYNIALSQAQTEQSAIETENLTLLQSKEYENIKLKEETDKLCDELHFERRAKTENITLDKVNNESIREMESANEYWRNK